MTPGRRIFCLTGARGLLSMWVFTGLGLGVRYRRVDDVWKQFFGVEVVVGCVMLRAMLVSWSD